MVGRQGSAFKKVENGTTCNFLEMEIAVKQRNTSLLKTERNGFLSNIASIASYIELSSPE